MHGALTALKREVQLMEGRTDEQDRLFVASCMLLNLDNFVIIYIDLCQRYDTTNYLNTS